MTRRICVVLALLAVALAAAQSSAFAGAKSANKLVVALTTSDEVPLCQSATDDARGKAVIRVTDATAGTVKYRLSVNNLPGDIIGAHIHQAPAGTPGPIVQPLELNTGAKNGVIGKGTFTNATLATALQSDPTPYYVNVHTSVCQPGVVRGQLDDSASAR
jgi:Cu/Zn superoxide dismutase